MRKHSLLGVLALAMLLAVAGMSTASAGQKQYLTPDGKCCILVNGQCEPCPESAGSTTSAEPAKSVSTGSAVPSLASACSGPCVPCPPGQGCSKAASCSPGSCNNGAGYTMIGVRDANTGQVVVYRVPTSNARILLAVSTEKSANPSI
ncbi:MAG: hypothetical protein NTW07_07505 [candidate division Zixibacteria bacterium]|nr:hypothetical protein [candidate division Zixibacteria bacterium]